MNNNENVSLSEVASTEALEIEEENEFSLSSFLSSIESPEEEIKKAATFSKAELDAAFKLGRENLPTGIAVPTDDPSLIDTPANLGSALTDSFTLFTAFEYYKELVKRAKKFNKAYAKLHNIKLFYWRTLQDPKIGSKYAKKYNPFVYHAAIESLDSVTDIAKRELISNASTGDDAALSVAYKLGFLDTLEFKTADQKFYPPAMEKIRRNPEYLAKVRGQNTAVEHSQQIKNCTYVPQWRKDTWAEELIKELQDMILKNKGAV
jgi:hypothetical protein